MSEVLLIGDSLPVRAAALELARLGISVHHAINLPAQVQDQANSLPAAEPLDSAAVADPAGDLREFMESVAKALTAHDADNPRIAATFVPAPQLFVPGADGAWAPLSAPHLGGIPAVPLAADSLRLCGSKAAFRAYLDRLLPVLTIGKEQNLARLVSSRMGAKMLEIVSPLVLERLAVMPDAADVQIFAPGLNEALTRTGSLSGAVLQLSEKTAQRELAIRPLSGWSEFGRQLTRRLRNYAMVDFAPVVQEITPIFDADSAANLPANSASAAAAEVGAAAESAAAESAAAEAAEVSGYSVLDTSGQRHSFAAIIIAREYLHLLPQLDAEPYQPLRTRWNIAFTPQAVALEHPVSGSDYVAIVTDLAGQPWSLRCSLSGDSWSGTCSSLATLADPPADANVQHLAAAAAAHGFPFAPEQSTLSQVVARAATLAEERALAARNAARAKTSRLLVCGTQLHGGELAAAVRAARAETVPLRRILRKQ